MKNMVERETILRSLKHILNKYIRDCNSDELLSDLISHILNCLLAPKDFLKKMDDGIIKNSINTIRKEADMNMINVGLDPNLNPEKLAQGNNGDKQTISKREKKRQKKAAKEVEVSKDENNENQDSQTNKGKKEEKYQSKDMSELLFKSPYDEV